jgi:hypothetical protein
VLLISPAGERVRAVVEDEAVGPISRAVEAAGARARPVPPCFEDLFLVKLAETGAAAGGEKAA